MAFNTALITVAIIIKKDAKFGCPSTRINWDKTPNNVEIGKHKNKIGAYALRYGIASAGGCKKLSIASPAKCAIITKIIHMMIVLPTDTVKYLLLPSSSKLPFMFKAKI